eukprot:1138607-Pelagomonas_calceolata.AAC.1
MKLRAGRLPGAQFAYNMLVKNAIALTELGYMPDFVLRAGIRQLLGMRASEPFKLKAWADTMPKKTPGHAMMYVHCPHETALLQRFQCAFCALSTRFYKSAWKALVKALFQSTVPTVNLHFY